VEGNVTHAQAETMKELIKELEVWCVNTEKRAPTPGKSVAVLLTY
jgi:hypothetical protein